MAPDPTISPPRGCPDCRRPTCPFCGALGYGCPHVLASSSPGVSGGWDISPFLRGPLAADKRGGRAAPTESAGAPRPLAERLPALAEPVIRVGHVKEKYLGLHQPGATYFAADPDRARAQLAALLSGRARRPSP